MSNYDKICNTIAQLDNNLVRERALRMLRNSDLTSLYAYLHGVSDGMSCLNKTAELPPAWNYY